MQILQAFLEQYNRVFWALFILSAVLLLASLFSSGILEIALGLILVTVGLHKLDLEIRHRNQENARKRIENHLHNIGLWINTAHSTTNDTRSKHEYRLHTLDKKRVSFEKKIDQQYRDLIRKFIESESKLNRLAKILEKKA